jgi:E1A/CREB-binding protein
MGTPFFCFSIALLILNSFFWLQILNRYMNTNCATEFPVRTKCITLFQRIHGIDTILFAVYVYEYGHSCPAPNKRRVYISYLDSAQYFAPKCFRTTAYHSILIEYLRYVKNRGFHTAHIWSCPPTPGDDFIFYCHPKHQLVPREDMLRSWYLNMLEKAKSQGVVIKTSTMYDEYFADISNRLPTCLPYFEGDYIPGEIENIITVVESNPVKGRSSSTIDEVMKRTGSNLAKMKENFIVIHLRSRGFAAAVERGEDVSNWKEDNDDDMVRSKRARFLGKGTLVHETVSEKDDIGRTVHEEYVDSESARSGCTTRSRRPSLSSVNTRSKTRSVKAELENKANPAASIDVVMQPQLDLQKGRSSHANDEFSDLFSVISSQFQGQKDRSDPIGDTSVFESRQQFLNYCQTNNCQFDELRRAKHSTIMLLYQLHNPTAPRFLQQCGACYREITHGFRYHCKVCVNFDLCADCYNPVVSGEWAKRDQRFAHDKSHKFETIDLEAKTDTRKSREEREKCLKAHVSLLEHASKCDGLSSCTLLNCQRLKKILSHVATCDTAPKRDCKICTRILLLCTVHSRLCNSRTSCPVPFCDRLRERSMRLRQQQQLMDDRRRNAQNHLYHAAAGAS